MAVCTPTRSRKEMKKKISNGFLLRSYEAVKRIQVKDDRVKKKEITRFLAKQESQMKKRWCARRASQLQSS